MKIKYEILLLLDWGLTPKEVIKLGYKDKTVYKFNATHKETLELCLQLLGANQIKIIKKLKTLWLAMLKQKQEKKISP